LLTAYRGKSFSDIILAAGPMIFFECPGFLSECRKERNESAKTHHGYGQSHEAF
jgi:hypothetical protein